MREHSRVIAYEAYAQGRVEFVEGVFRSVVVGVLHNLARPDATLDSTDGGVTDAPEWSVIAIPFFAVVNQVVIVQSADNY